MAIAHRFLHREQEPPDIDPLVRLYRQAELEIRDRAQQRLVKDARKLTSEAKRARMLEREILEILGEIDDEADLWIAKNIPKQYMRGVKEATQGLRDIGFDVDVTVNPGIHKEAVEALVASMQEELAIGSARIIAAAGRLVRETQLDTVVDKQITQQVALGTIEGQARKEVSENIRQVLVDEFGEGPVIINGRHYGMDTYSELVARTKMAEAHSIGTIMRNVEAGNDLVMVSSHGADDGCSFFEGQIFSISGTNEKYPALAEIDNGPPFHPNCIHRLLPFVEELATEKEIERGTKVPSWALGKSHAELERAAKTLRAA